MPTSRAAVAEFIGTFALMFCGGAAIILTGGQDLLIIALAHGLVLAAMVSATLHISGGQFNPAVSIALAVTGRQDRTRTGVFVAAQIAGAAAAAAILQAAFSGSHDTAAVKLGATLGSLSSGEGASLVGVIVLEFIATLFLMFVIMGTAVDARAVGGSTAIGGFGIGLVVIADILAFGQLTGASMNPARSLGPQIVGGAAGIEGVFSMAWVYWLVPIVAAVATAVVYDTVFSKTGVMAPESE